MPVKPIDLKYVEDKAANIYEAIVVASKRARQINEELKIEFNQRVELVRTNLMDVSEESVELETNPDQVNIAREFEMRPKPTETALNELMKDALEYRYKDENHS
jgi:DNA-directed RNA polymerase subunit K/omega